MQLSKKESLRHDQVRATHQRRTCSAPGLTMLVGVLRMKFTTLSNAAPKYS